MILQYVSLGLGIGLSIFLFIVFRKVQDSSGIAFASLRKVSERFGVLERELRELDTYVAAMKSAHEQEHKSLGERISSTREDHLTDLKRQIEGLQGQLRAYQGIAERQKKALDSYQALLDDKILPVMMRISEAHDRREIVIQVNASERESRGVAAAALRKDLEEMDVFLKEYAEKFSSKT